MRTISQREMRNDSGQVLRDVEGGEEIIVTRRGTPVAQLVPYRDRTSRMRPARRRPVFSAADLVHSDTTSEDVLAELRDER